MKKLYFFIGLSFILVALGCEEESDSYPPTVYITKPLQSSIVSEIAITVKCVATDNDSVKFVELLTDSAATGLVDSSAPYEFCEYSTLWR